MISLSSSEQDEEKVPSTGKKKHSWKKMCIKNKNKALLVNKGQFQKTTGNF